MALILIAYDFILMVGETITQPISRPGCQKYRTILVISSFTKINIITHNITSSPFDILSDHLPKPTPCRYLRQNTIDMTIYNAVYYI